jgi:isoleucyl-tRNA synthetase
MDHLFRDLTKMNAGLISVHLTDFPSSDKSMIFPKLQNKVNRARVITSLALSLRKKEQIKVRQPLKTIMIPVNSEYERQELISIENQLKSEINIKELKIIDNSSGILVKTIKPNFKVLGPRYGKDIKSIAKSIDLMNSDEINELEQNGEILIKFNEKNIKLVANDVEISSKDIEGWLVANGSGVTVALDVSLDEELIREGIAREFVNRVQNYRKDLGLDVTDKIQIFISNNSTLNKAISNFKQYIKNETLAESISLINQTQDGIELEFDKIKISVLIKKIT